MGQMGLVAGWDAAATTPAPNLGMAVLQTSGAAVKSRELATPEQICFSHFPFLIGSVSLLLNVLFVPS